MFLKYSWPKSGSQGKILRKDDRDFDKVIIVYRMEVNTIHTV